VYDTKYSSTKDTIATTTATTTTVVLIRYVWHWMR